MPPKKKKKDKGPTAGAERDELLKRSQVLAQELQKQSKRNADLASAQGAELMNLSELEVKLQELQRQHSHELSAQTRHLEEVRRDSLLRSKAANDAALDQAGFLVATSTLRQEVEQLRSSLRQQEEEFEMLKRNNALAEEQFERDQFEVRTQLSNASRGQLQAITGEMEANARATMQQRAVDSGPQNEALSADLATQSAQVVQVMASFDKDERKLKNKTREVALLRSSNTLAQERVQELNAQVREYAFIVAETQLQIKELTEEVSAHEQGCRQRNVYASQVEFAKKQMVAAKEEALKLARELNDQAKALGDEEVWAWEVEPLSDTVWKQPPPPQRTGRSTTKRVSTKPRALEPQPLR